MTKVVFLCLFCLRLFYMLSVGYGCIYFLTIIGFSNLDSFYEQQRYSKLCFTHWYRWFSFLFWKAWKSSCYFTVDEFTSNALRLSPLLAFASQAMSVRMCVVSRKASLKVVTVTVVIFSFQWMKPCKVKKIEKDKTDASEKRNCIVMQCGGYRLQRTTLRYCCSKLPSLS